MLDSRTVSNLAHNIAVIREQLLADMDDHHAARRSVSYLHCVAAMDSVSKMAVLLRDLTPLTAWPKAGVREEIEKAGGKQGATNFPDKEV